MSTNRTRQLLVVVSALCLGVASAANAGWGASRQLPSSYFNQDDWKLLRQAIRAVIDSEKPDAVERWSNPSNDHSGVVSSLRSFSSGEGRPCRFLQIENRAEGRAGSMRYTVCRDTEGVWRDADSGAPFTSPDDAAGAGSR